MSTCASCTAALPGGARFCPACGAEVDAGVTRPERKLATVLFADLVGSTTLGEGDPERTRALLDRFYDAMAAEIDAAGGTVEKFAGDAVMAAFGVPVAHEDHAERALHAALSMLRRLEETFGGALALRVGVNTGDVVAARPRAGSSFVTGDAVNVAARLQQAAAPGEILVGERTAAAVRGAFELAEPQTVEARGKTVPVVARRLVRALSLMRPRGVGGLRRAFVGRDTELELLKATYRHTVEQGEPHLVTIMGESGVGKTTLVRELWQWLAAEQPQPLQRTGRTLPYGHVTYWPLGEILKEHLGIRDSDPASAVRAKLSGREVLGLTLGLDVAPDLHPLTARDRLHAEWVDFLAAATGERPVVVLVEDLHWAEDPLLDLLERVVREVGGPVLLVVTTRPELLDRRRGWGGGRRNSSIVWLEPLAPADAARLVDDLLASRLPRELRDRLVARAEGNPFFVEELLASLIERGVLVRTEGGGWDTHVPTGDFDVPDSVQSLIAARLDLLPGREKVALQAASVVGRVFWSGPVAVLTADAGADWALLEDRDFVRRRVGTAVSGETEYAFKHALTREVAYSTLPRAARARLHASFADWLHEAVPGDERAALLAHHYAEAARPDDADLAWADDPGELARLRAAAVTWLHRAAASAVGRYDLADATAQLERALTLEEGPVERAALWRELGNVHALRYDGEAFWDAMQRSLEICFDRDVCADSYSLLAFHTVTRAGMWQKRPDWDALKEWTERALELAEEGTVAYARASVAHAYWLGDDVDAAARAVAHAAAVGDLQLRSYATEARARAHFARLEYDQAYELSVSRFGLVETVDDPDHAAGVREDAVPAVVAVGRIDEARRIAAEARTVAAKLSPHHRLHAVSLPLEIAEAVCDWESVLELRDEVERAVADNEGTPCVRNSRSLLLAAAASLWAGDDAAAARYEDAAAGMPFEGYDIVLDPPLLRLALLRGDLETVERMVARQTTHRHLRGMLGSRYVVLDALVALRDRERIEALAPPFVVPGTLVEPYALRALAVAREDDELLERAAARFDALGLPHLAAPTRGLVLQA